MATKNPLDVNLSADRWQEIESWLVQEIRTAKAARSIAIEDGGLIDYCYALYEQRSQQPVSSNSPDFGEPDLTSPIATENVDTLSARAAQTLFRLEPFWIVEGIGPESAKKAPIVEAFMQVRQEAMRFQKVAKRGITASFVETGSVLEVCEDVEPCIKTDVVKAKLRLNDIDGTFLLDGKSGKPLPMLDDDGYPVEAEEADLAAQAFVEVTHTYQDYKRRGAYVRLRSMKDVLMLPGHASDDHEVWGQATRFWLTSDAIKRKVEAKDYKKGFLDRCGLDTMERVQSAEADRQGVTVDYVPGSGHAEHELWKVQFWADLEDKGLQFYVAYVSEVHGAMAAIRTDWLQQYRAVYLNPFPCPYSVYGYSMVFTKLGSTIEEHTAWRNMNAKRSTLKSNAPHTVLRSSQYDPRITPIGAGEFISVDRHDEIAPMQFEDVTPQAMNKEQQCVTDGQRILGMNDIAIGQVSAERRTLGENEMATRQSFVRTDDPIGNLQESFEELGSRIFEVELQTLKDMGSMQAPASVTAQLKYGGVEGFDGTFTPDMLAGEYRFKPRGSSDAADPVKRAQQWAQGIAELANYAKVNPLIAQRMASEPFADAVMQEWVDQHKPRDRKVFLEPIQQPQAPPGMPMPGQPAPPAGTPPGAPAFGGEEVLQQVLANVGGAQ